MASITSITAEDLIAWGNNFQARFTLPQLVRRLVLASSQKVTRLQLPSDEQVSRPGFDGIVQVSNGNAWCPDGLSVWEMGATHRPAKKADGDFEKRNKKPGVASATATFVFVTPSKWLQHEKWCVKKRREKKWKDVRALDCSDLAEWLDSVPSVAFWVARLIGKRPANVWDLTGQWENLRDLSVPKLRPGVFLAGREHETSIVETWLKQKHAPLYVEADSPDEVIDFFAAFALGTVQK